MSLAPNTQALAQEELPKDVAELSDAIGALPVEHRAKLELLMARVVESTKRRRRILALVQDALSQLRLDMKYLVFDLEATRRERDSLRSPGSDGDLPLDDQI
jgi:nitric oxide reductase activation protein